jgi:hypothetical protein
MKSIGSPFTDRSRKRLKEKNKPAKTNDSALADSPRCGRCQQASEMALHIACDCEALATLRFRHLGQHLWNQVTWRTSLLVAYCTSLKGLGCWIHEHRSCAKAWLWSKCLGHYIACPSVVCCIIFCSVLRLSYKLLFLCMYVQVPGTYSMCVCVCVCGGGGGVFAVFFITYFCPMYMLNDSYRWIHSRFTGL